MLGVWTGSTDVLIRDTVWPVGTTMADGRSGNPGRSWQRVKADSFDREQKQMPIDGWGRWELGACGAGSPLRWPRSVRFT